MIRLGGLTVLCGIVLALNAATMAGAETEAVLGRPFGVGRVTVALEAGQSQTAWLADGFLLRERRGRALYPVFTSGRFRKLLGEVLGDSSQTPPDSITAWFLFTGTEPLELTLSTPAARRITATPTAPRNPRGHQRLLLSWWREYHASVRDQLQHGDYPPLVQTYLTSMLSRRLGLETPLLSRRAEKQPSEPQATLELLLGLESLRLAALRRTSLGELPPDEPADQPLPADIAWQPLPPPLAGSQVEIEPLALHVPHDCFYIRFGSYENYLWLTHLQDDYGGDLRRMITLRGYDARVGEKMQRQLTVQQTELSDIFGPAVVADLALIGRDLYRDEGAAVGVLFQARNALLGSDLQRQREAACAAEKRRGATLTTVPIAGQKVSLLSTPDNWLRSYYAVRGDFHLVTTTRAIVERFLAIEEGRGSLGASAEFRHARTVLPTSRQDTIFVYFSSAFFQGLVSPQYQVELSRRLRATTDLALVRLARWAARAEGKPADTIDDLVRGDLLPAGFGRRADGSTPLLDGERVVDSLRGPAGYFTPVPDVAVRAITRSEAARLSQQAGFFTTGFRQFDPLMLAVKRYALDRPGLERVVLDAHMSPFAEQKYGWVASLLGAPTPWRIKPAPGDIITAQVAIKGGLLLPAVPPHHLFLGVQDTVPLADLPPTGPFQTLMLLRSTPGYLGAWPKPGFLDRLPLGLLGTQPDALGYSRFPLGVWRRQWADFSALSFDANLLARTTPHLVPEQMPTAAQIRIHVGDVSQAKLQAWINSLAYSRAYAASLGNARLLHALSSQLAVPRAEALAAAEQLLGAPLLCSLGGQYRPAAAGDGTVLWTSSQWPQPPDRRPDNYRAPLLEWFRGLDADLTKHADRVVLHGSVDIQRKPTEKAPLLPLFDLFGGGKAVSKTAPPPPPEPAPAGPPPPPAKKPPPGPQEF
jgi:hypothetical protein